MANSTDSKRMESMTDEFKPCPFCGGKADVWLQQRVICLDCGTEGPDTGEVTETLGDRIRAWNTRTPLEDQACERKGSTQSIHDALPSAYD